MTDQAKNKHPRRPRDLNQLAKSVVDLATDQAEEVTLESNVWKDPAALSLGRLGGLKGGKARAVKLSPKKRAEAQFDVPPTEANGAFTAHA